MEGVERESYSVGLVRLAWRGERFCEWQRLRPDLRVWYITCKSFFSYCFICCSSGTAIYCLHFPFIFVFISIFFLPLSSKHLHGVVVSRQYPESAAPGSSPGQRTRSSFKCSSSMYGLVDRKVTWGNLGKANCGDPAVTRALCAGVIDSYHYRLKGQGNGDEHQGHSQQ